MPNKELTICSPVFNDASALVAFFKKADWLFGILTKQGWDTYFVLIDDKSTDESLKQCEKFASSRPWAKVIAHEQSLGYGATIKTALASTRTEWMVFVDITSNYDQVMILDLIGQDLESFDILNVSFPSRTPGSAFLYKTFFPLLTREIASMESGFRLYRMAILEDIFPESDGFYATSEILLRARKAEHVVLDLPAKNTEAKPAALKAGAANGFLGHLGLVLKARLLGLPRSAGPQSHLARTKVVIEVRKERATA